VPVHPEAPAARCAACAAAHAVFAASVSFAASVACAVIGDHHDVRVRAAPFHLDRQTAIRCIQ
jgi:hypothetical protein